MKRVNVIAADNHAGLSRSARIVQGALSAAGFRVEVTDAGRRDLPRRSFDVNVFMESIDPAWLPRAGTNFLIPNQEWFPVRQIPYLDRIDGVLCKTRHARDIFRRLGCRAEFTSFTSEDRLDTRRRRDHGRFFHAAGRSLQKGTAVIAALWQRHPEWPPLTMVQHPETRLDIDAANVAYRSEHLNDAELRRLQNAHGVHVCPSEAEGFGHYIVEAMSCGAAVITTDAPPMNELVTPDRGVLARYHQARPQALGTAYHVDPAALARAVEAVAAMDPGQRERMGRNAREWYLENDAYFRRAIVEVMRNA